MEAVLFAAVAVVFAGAFGFCSSGWAMEKMRLVRSGSTQGLVEKDGRIAWLMRRGIRPFAPFAERSVRIPAMRLALMDGMSVLERKGFATSIEALASVAIAACLGMFGLVWLVTRSFVTGILVALCVGVVTVVLVRAAQEKEDQATWEQTPEVVRSLSACLSAGLSLEQAFDQLEKESQGALRIVFGRMAGVLKTGGTTDQALEVLKSYKVVPELAFVAAALDVHHQTGGSLRQVLDSARDMVDDELELRRSLRVQTAQAKLSARIVTVMPFLLVTLFSLTTEGFLEPFFQSAAGFALLSLAVLMQVAGVLLVRQMLSVQE